MRFATVLLLGAFAAGCTAKDKDNDGEGTDTPNAFEGLWKIESVTETGDGGDCDSTPIDITDDFPTKYVKVSEASLIVTTALVGYSCTTETDCEDDALFPFIALDEYDDEGGSGTYTVTSGGGDVDCSLQWTRFTLGWVEKDTDAQVVIKSESNADVVTGADLDECSEKQESYSGAYNCTSQTVITVSRVQ